MVTLFIISGEALIGSSLFVLLALYGLSSYMLSFHRELDSRISNLSDEALIERFHSLAEDYDKSPSYKKGQELAHILNARKKRKLLDNVTDAELATYYHRLTAAYEQAPTYWKKQELAYYNKEVEKRHLL